MPLRLWTFIDRHSAKEITISIVGRTYKEVESKSRLFELNHNKDFYTTINSLEYSLSIPLEYLHN